MDCVDKWIMDKECVRDYHELLTDYVHGIFDNLINFMCPDENAESNRCERYQIMPPLNAKQQELIKPYESFMFILIEIMDSLK